MSYETLLYRWILMCDKAWNLIAINKLHLTEVQDLSKTSAFWNCTAKFKAILNNFLFKKLPRFLSEVKVGPTNSTVRKTSLHLCRGNQKELLCVKRLHGIKILGAVVERSGEKCKSKNCNSVRNQINSSPENPEINVKHVCFCFRHCLCLKCLPAHLVNIKNH